MSTEPRAQSAADDPLAELQVIDVLEVGPVELEKDKLSMPYRVHQAGQVSSNELVYRFEESLFDPEDVADQNLASMIGAQVALNYGLFCRQILLRGPFDAVDRGFLLDMATNTAREIYVKKFLEPNPFLIGPAAEMPVVRQQDYLRAELRFPDLEEGVTAVAKQAQWTAGRERIGVLSSGGKDSLLSYGLLDELGQEPQAVFVNESGRHWHTALNGYRYLRDAAPERTTRVWTSADRIFTWMLRHLPFVRQDFARLRSDEYPIRLWTVAVFLFGALPVLRGRGVTRLAIGDEYDTTRRVRHQGVTHYDGLYDQSRYFDEAMTRYFRRKGWPLKQFSILRQMSELLIEKVLVERYPELQRHQMSCHATHVVDERALPCGKCEKCRRVVGMLVALGADPCSCGYTAQQITSCLEALPGEGVHQEAAGARHLLWLLEQQGHVTSDPTQPARKPQPEVLQLRFDKEASPPDALPRDLRRALYPIYLQHADGAVKKTGRTWSDLDLVTDPWVSAPYRQRRSGAKRGKQEPRPRGVDSSPVLLGELSWVEAQRRLEDIDTALLPVGAIEQHGPHLPLDTDAWDAEYLCKEVALRCSDPKPLVLPLIPYGVSYHHDDFAGTISVGPDALAQFVYDVGMSAARHGIVKLVIINGHGGNAPTLQLAAQKINRDARIFTCVDSGETSDSDIAELTETPNDVHAGEIETSTALATRAHLVDMRLAEAAVPDFSSKYLDFTSAHSVAWYEHTAKISPSGVLGDPTKASVEKGERVWEMMIDHLVKFVEMMKTLSLEQIYERRH